MKDNIKSVIAELRELINKLPAPYRPARWYWESFGAEKYGTLCIGDTSDAPRSTILGMKYAWDKFDPPKYTAPDDFAAELIVATQNALPHILEYVEELETKIEMECTTASNLDARYIIPEGIKVAGGHMAMSYIEDLGGEIRIMQAQLKKQQERISVLEASCQKK